MAKQLSAAKQSVPALSNSVTGKQRSSLCLSPPEAGGASQCHHIRRANEQRVEHDTRAGWHECAHYHTDLNKSRSCFCSKILDLCGLHWLPQLGILSIAKLMEAIDSRLEAISRRLEAIALRLEAIALVLFTDFTTVFLLFCGLQ